MSNKGKGRSLNSSTSTPGSSRPSVHVAIRQSTPVNRTPVGPIPALFTPSSDPLVLPSQTATSRQQPRVLIYQHVRNLCGIVSTLLSPQPKSDDLVMSLGALADRYLRSHRYTPKSWQKIVAIYKTSERDFAVFEERLCQRGMPQAEVRFLWEIINHSATGWIEI